MSKLKIPESWSEEKIEDLASQLGRGKSPSYSDKETGYFAINQKCIYWNEIKLENRKPVLKNWFLSVREDFIAKPNDILINSTGTGTLGRACVWLDESLSGIPDTHITMLRLKPELDPKFYKYFLQSKSGQSIIANATTGSTNQIELNKSKFGIGRVPVPPAKEQQRIVAKIESTQGKIKTIESNVAQADALIEKYRESILKKAFRGQLVPQNPNDEPASKLIERIRSERDKHGDPKKNKKNDLPPIKPEDIPFVIPKSWEWERLGIFAEDVSYGSSSKTNDNSSGVAVLRMGNIQNGKLDFESLKYLPKNHEEFPALFLKDGDLIFNRTNSPELVGKSAIFYEKSKSFSFASYLIRLRFSKNTLLPEYVSLFINSTFGRDWANSVMIQQVGQANINGTKLKECLIPIPPTNEQKQILNRIEAEFKLIDSLEEKIESINENTKNFVSVILSSAFSGRLVTQNSSEGTGHDLLNKITSQQVPQRKIESKAVKANKKKKSKK